MIALLLALQAVPAGEQSVDPYAVWQAFRGEAGTRRIVDDFVIRITTDPRIADIFKTHDPVRLRRTLFEQFCHILGGGCDYTGMDMRQAHKDMGIQQADMNALVENLQLAMSKEGVPFFAQNRLLAKLAPMKREVVER
jgi:hemoglobin